MVQVNDIVWIAYDGYSLKVFTNESAAREEYFKTLRYYKGHIIPTDSDHWVYRVWGEVDDDMHYAIVEGSLDDGSKRTLYIGYESRIILK